MNRNGHEITKLDRKCKCGKSLYQFDNIWIYCNKCDYLERIDNHDQRNPRQDQQSTHN